MSTLISQGRDYIAAVDPVLFKEVIKKNLEIKGLDQDQVDFFRDSSAFGRMTPAQGYDFAKHTWSNSKVQYWSTEIEFEISRDLFLTRCQNIVAPLFEGEREKLGAAQAYVLNKVLKNTTQEDFVKSGDLKKAEPALSKLLNKWKKAASNEIQLKSSAQKKAKEDFLASPEYKISILEKEIAALEKSLVPVPVLNLEGIDIDFIEKQITNWKPRTRESEVNKSEYLAFLKKVKAQTYTGKGFTETYLLGETQANCLDEWKKLNKVYAERFEAIKENENTESRIKNTRAEISKLKGEDAPVAAASAPIVKAQAPQEAAKPEPKPADPEPKKLSACARFFQKIGNAFKAFGRWIASLFTGKKKP